MTQHVPSRALPALLVLSACLLAACGDKADTTLPEASSADTPVVPEKIVVRLGHVAPLTGPQAHLGKDNENGARLAIDDLNAENFKIGAVVARFELLGEDDQADPRQGTTVAQKLADSRVNAVIGHLNSGTTIPASRIYHDAGIVQVSPSATNPQYTRQGYKGAFRVFADDVQQGGVLGTFATGKLGVKRIAIIDDRTAYGQGLADEFEKAAKAAGATIVTREYTTDKATDFAAILTKVKSTTPDLLFYGGMDTQAGPMARQLKTLGVGVPMLFGDGACTVEFHKLAGDGAEGHYCSLPGVPLDKMAGGTAFRERYKTKFQHRYPALCALRLRRGARGRRGDEEGRFDRCDQVPAGTGRHQLSGADRADRVRRKGRHQGRRGHAVSGPVGGVVSDGDDGREGDAVSAAWTSSSSRSSMVWCSAASTRWWHSATRWSTASSG
jgi:branched-chain amino acid transport system substrate-binding protein